MPDIFKIAKLPYLNVELHYQGRSINRLFYRQNPGIFTCYPSLDNVREVRSNLLATKAVGIVYTIVVYEEGVYIIEA